MKLLDSRPKKLGTAFFFLGMLAPILQFVVPRVDYSCGDGSCMFEGIIFRYIIFALAALSYYLAAVFFLRVALKSYWQSALLAIPLVLLVSPRGYFNFF